MISKRLVDSAKVVTGLAPITPSTSTPDYVSLKNYGHFTAIITVDNATTVTGSAITLKQCTVVAGTDEKALAFTKVWANVDTAASDALVETAVVSSTFTTDSTNNKNLMYVIEVDAAELDVSNGFDCIRVGTGDATAAVVSVVYVLSNPRYAGATSTTAITD
jgi:3-deoxy-D-manno-octulosonate 8-phosphate phosphatase KdsC-like HAD superfamily phosphatase